VVRKHLGDLGRYGKTSSTSSLGCAVDQAVRRRPLTPEARVRSRLVYVISDGQSETGTNVSPLFSFTLSVSSHRDSISSRR
jgi:hypothetical protein